MDNNYICNYDIDSINNLDAEDQLDIMYNLFDEAAELHLVRKKIIDHDNSVKRKFIPENIRKLLRKKLRLSKGKLDSNYWRKYHKLIEKIENIDEQLKAEYKKQRHVDENRALCKIKKRGTDGVVRGGSGTFQLAQGSIFIRLPNRLRWELTGVL